MGSRPHPYLGPYVECTQRELTRQVSVHGCTNISCKLYPKDQWAVNRRKFCPECAAPIGEVTITVPGRTDRYDVVGDNLFEMENTKERVDRLLYLAPNVQRDGDPTRARHYSHDEIHLNMIDVDPKAEIAWMEKAFAEEVAKLKGAYDNVTVKWGFHLHWM